MSCAALPLVPPSLPLNMDDRVMTSTPTMTTMTSHFFSEVPEKTRKNENEATS